MCGSMADIQSTAAEIRREKKKRRKNKLQHENIMVCPIPYGDHNECGVKYDTEYSHTPNFTITGEGMGMAAGPKN